MVLVLKPSTVTNPKSINSSHEKIGENKKTARKLKIANLQFRGLGRPWVVTFVGFITILTCFPIQVSMLLVVHSCQTYFSIQQPPPYSGHGWRNNPVG